MIALHCTLCITNYTAIETFQTCFFLWPESLGGKSQGREGYIDTGFSYSRTGHWCIPKAAVSTSKFVMRTCRVGLFTYMEGISTA